MCYEARGKSLTLFGESHKEKSKSHSSQKVRGERQQISKVINSEKTAKSHDRKSKSHRRRKKKKSRRKSHVQKNFSKLPLVVRRDAFMFMFFGSGCHEPATYSVPFAGAIPTLWLVFPDAECSNGVPVPLVEQNQQRDAGID